MRTWDQELFRRAGLDRPWVQENQSRNDRSGIIRGLHFQFPPATETKLVRCVQGSIFDVYVDLRRGSPTFGRWGGSVLSEENHRMLFIPKGFAHGYCTLSVTSIVLYKVDHPYEPAREGGLLWNDPDLAIAWPMEQPPILSIKDGRNMSFRRFQEEYGGLDIVAGTSPGD